jgi:hypothetical protein
MNTMLYPRSRYRVNGIGHGFLLSGGQYTTLDDPNAGTFPGTQPFGINDRGQIVGNYYDANSVSHGFLADPVHGNSTAGDPSSPSSVTVPAPAATPSVVLVTVPLAQLTPTLLPAVNVPVNPGVQTGVGVGGPFNGATTAVLTVPGMASGAGAVGHQDASIPANDLLMSNLDNVDSSWL